MFSHVQKANFEADDDLKSLLLETDAGGYLYGLEHIPGERPLGAEGCRRCISGW